MSGGRVELGLGAGWFEREHAAYGIPFPALGERFDRLAEQLEIVTGLWGAGGSFSFTGSHYTLTDSPALPKPVQPAVPVIVGGHGRKRTPELAARFASEFNVAFSPLEVVAAQFERVDAACRAIGRDPASLVRSAGHTIAVGRDDPDVARRVRAIGRDAADVGLAGTVDQVVGLLGRWRERTGITRMYLQLLDLGDLDQLELIAAKVAPQLQVRSRRGGGRAPPARRAAPRRPPGWPRRRRSRPAAPRRAAAPRSSAAGARPRRGR